MTHLDGLAFWASGLFDNLAKVLSAREDQRGRYCIDQFRQDSPRTDLKLLTVYEGHKITVRHRKFRYLALGVEITRYVIPEYYVERGGGNNEKKKRNDEEENGKKEKIYILYVLFLDTTWNAISSCLKLLEGACGNKIRPR